MEERVPPAANGNQNNHNLDPNPPDHNSLQPPFRSGTYVVQVPKDQIYRVPTPENALMAENHRNPVQYKKPCYSRFLYCFIFVAILVLVIAAIASISTIVLKPKNPMFSIQHFLVKNQNNSDPEYDIRIKVQNPNGHSGILYMQGGVVSLSFKQQEIATGKYPSFLQYHKNSTVLEIVLHGSKEIEKIIKTEKSKLHVSLFLKIIVPVEMKVTAFHTGNVKIDVACNFMVDKLGKDTRVLSQKCSQRKL